MTTTEVANKLYQYCLQGDYANCYSELYSPDCQSIEADGTTVVGLEAMAEKGKQWNEGIAEFYGSSVGKPIVSGTHFSLAMSLKLKYKGDTEATNFEEICVYQVKDGKVVKEQFFYD